MSTFPWRNVSRTDAPFLPPFLHPQTWAMLEVQCGNVDSARKLFDAALVADERHVAAWHGWAVLELREGHAKKARELLERGQKLCGANEYILQVGMEQELWKQ